MLHFYTLWKPPEKYLRETGGGCIKSHTNILVDVMKGAKELELESHRTEVPTMIIPNQK